MFEQTKAELATALTAELDLSDAAGLADEMRELHEIGRLALVARLQRLDLFDQINGCVDDGQVTSAAWQRTELGIGHAAAKAEVTVARVRRTCPTLSAVYESGATTFRHLQAAAAAIRRLDQPEIWTLLDERIADWAQKTTIAEYTAMLDELVQQLLPEPKPKERQQHEKRRLAVSSGFDGMVNVHGRLTPEVGEKLHAALSAASRPDVDGEIRTTGQRKADALDHLLDTTLDNALLPVDGGEKPHITVLVPLDELAEDAAPEPSRANGSSLWPTTEDSQQRARAAAAAAEAMNDKPRFSWTGPTSSSTARRLSCDGILLPIFTRGTTPIDVGRSYRTVSTPMRAFIVARDQHCQWPDCTIPARWCVCHHVLHWKDGGTTDRWNLLLLCPHHHKAAHNGRWTIVLHAPGTITVQPRHHPDDPYYDIRIKAPPPPSELGLDLDQQPEAGTLRRAQ
jgi:uncharacterized protein DUF222